MTVNDSLSVSLSLPYDRLSRVYPFSHPVIVSSFFFFFSPSVMVKILLESISHHELNIIYLF